MACFEFIARRPNAIVDAYNRCSTSSFANAKYLAPLGDDDELPAPSLRNRMTFWAEGDWDVETEEVAELGLHACLHGFSGQFLMAPQGAPARWIFAWSLMRSPRPWG